MEGDAHVALEAPHLRVLVDCDQGGRVVYGDPLCARKHAIKLGCKHRSKSICMARRSGSAVKSGTRTKAKLAGRLRRGIGAVFAFDLRSISVHFVGPRSKFKTWVSRQGQYQETVQTV